MDIKYYKVYDEHKRYIKRIKQKNELQDNNFLKGVTCFVVDEFGRVLIERRASKSRLMPGQLDLCSGHVDGNETYTQAMIREYVEELHSGEKVEEERARNEAISNLKPLDELDLCFKNGINTRNFFIKFYTLKTTMKDVSYQKEEVDEVFWISMDQVFELIRQGKTKFPYDERYEEIFTKVQQNYRGIKSLQIDKTR